MKYLSNRQQNLKVGISSYTENKTVLEIIGNSNISGIVSAIGGFNLGISSAGTPITSGPITTLNFVGAGNTFAINGTTVDISIAGGEGGGGGASVSIGAEPPEDPNEGDLWYSSILGRTFIYYVDDDSSQWVDASPFNQSIIESLGSFETQNLIVTGQASVVGVITASSFSGTATSTTNIPNLTGDVTSSNTVTTLATVNSNVGTFGSSTTIPNITVNAKGLVTGVTTSAITSGLSVTNDTSTNSTFYPTFTSVTSGSISGANVSSTKLTFNPSTGTLTTIDVNTTSDINLKENIKTLENPIEKVMQLNGVSFDWKETQEPSIGVIAQEVEKIFPELVKTGENKTVNYNGLIGVLIEAIKDQQKQIEELKGLIKDQ
jgi:hypothetical protein